eukprot:GCRY01005208.1.p1 GENE.GCRY01005208.1~~GCRY01005208.1.p1  ORF type:complete len:524 (+),score=124.65 GCRY01005208.1:172-1743(+)
MESHQGQLPIELAREAGCLEVEKLLLASGSPSVRERMFKTHIPRYLLFAFALFLMAFSSPILCAMGMWRRFPVGSLLYRLAEACNSFWGFLWSFLTVYGPAAAFLCVVGFSLHSNSNSYVSGVNAAVLEIGAWVLALITLLSLTHVTIRARHESRFFTVSRVSHFLRLTGRNALDLVALVIEFAQLVAFTAPWPEVAVFTPMHRAFDLSLLNFGDDFSVTRVSYLMMFGGALVWALVAGYITLCLFVLDKDSLKRKFPFVETNFIEKIPGLEYIVPIISNIGFLAVLSVSLKALHCVEAGPGSPHAGLTPTPYVLANADDIVCWSANGEHLKYSWGALLTLVHYVPTSTFIGLYFLDSSLPKANIRFTGWFQLISRLLKGLAGASHVFLPRNITRAVVLVVAFVLSFKVFRTLPCKEVRSVNIGRGISFVLVMWSAMVALARSGWYAWESPTDGVGENIATEWVTAGALLGGWVLITFLWVYVQRITSLFTARSTCVVDEDEPHWSFGDPFVDGNYANFEMQI